MGIVRDRARSALIYPVLAILFVFLTGCSSSEIKNKPTELKPLKQDINVQKIWEASVGSGTDDQFLQLTPFVSDKFVYGVGYEGLLSQFDRKTAERLWKKDLDYKVLAGLGGDAKNLYLGNDKGELVALSRKNGSERWRKALSSEIISTPSSNGKLVVAQTVDGKLFALNAATGKQLWRYDSIAPVLSVRGTAQPYIDGEKTITGFANGNVVAISNKDGHVLWTFSVGIPKGKTELERLVDVDGMVSVVDNKVLAVSYQGDLVELDATTGQELWSLPDSSYGSPEVGLDHIYLSTSDSDVIAYNIATQKQAWKQEDFKYRRITSPVVFGDTVVVADFKGYLHFLSQLDGHRKARVQLDSDGVVSPLLVSGKTLFVQSNGGDLAAYQLGH